MNNKKRGRSFTELCRTPIKEKRNLIISKDTEGNIVIAQQLLVNEGRGEETAIFMKGSIEIDPALFPAVVEAMTKAYNILKK